MPPPMQGPARRALLGITALHLVQHVTSTRQPDAPMGWPMAIAPPLTFTLLASMSSTLFHGASLGGKGFIQFK